MKEQKNPIDLLKYYVLSPVKFSYILKIDLCFQMKLYLLCREEKTAHLNAYILILTIHWEPDILFTSSY